MLFLMKSLHQKARIEYSKLKPVTCPALGGEIIYFYNSDYEHLIRKGRRFRPAKDVIRRKRLLRHVRHLLEEKEALLISDRLVGVTFWKISKNMEQSKLLW